MCFIYTLPRSGFRFERGRAKEPEWPSSATTGLNFSEMPAMVLLRRLLVQTGGQPTPFKFVIQQIALSSAFFVRHHAATIAGSVIVYW